MKIKYDLHIHSALSPCSDDNMTPNNICGFAKLKGLDVIAVADHNAIDNVEATIIVGREFGVTVIPAMELQTEEDIHVLCLFEKFSDLKSFYSALSFMDIENRVEIFGNQLIINQNDEIVGTEKRLLLAAAKIPIGEVYNLVNSYGGIAIPAHIDREANGIITILGEVTEEFKTVEISKHADEKFINKYRKNHRIIIDSDAHTLEDIGGGEMELQERSAKALIDYLKGK